MDSLPSIVKTLLSTAASSVKQAQKKIAILGVIATAGMTAAVISANKKPSKQLTKADVILYVSGYSLGLNANKVLDENDYADLRTHLHNMDRYRPPEWNDALVEGVRDGNQGRPNRYRDVDLSKLPDDPREFQSVLIQPGEDP